MFLINSDNSIHISQPNMGATLVNTELKVTQTATGTVVYISGQHYTEFEMPHTRYSLAHDKPASGVAGRAQFEADIRALMLTFA